MLNTAPAPVECAGCRGPLEQLLTDCFLCRSCATIKFGDLEDMAHLVASMSERREILDCFFEDTHRGARGGGGGNGKARRKPPKPFERTYAGMEDVWGSVGGGPFGKPDAVHKTECDLGSKNSRPVAVRLSQADQATLEHLAQRFGSPASAIRAGLAALQALEYARQSQEA